MHTTYELLVTAHRADLHREASHRRLGDSVCTCARRLLGIFPVRQPCAEAGGGAR
jgi:hypothetical protein